MTKPEVRSLTAAKSGQLAGQLKPILSDQQHRLHAKHGFDADLIEDLRTYIKIKCSIEKDYAQALIKLTSNHQKKYPQFQIENDPENGTKSLYTAWKTYLEEIDRNAKYRLGEFDQISGFCDQLKEMKSHKNQVAKRCLDQHLKKMHEELLHSIADLDKQRRGYHEEEHVAKQARDKEEKLKKKKAGIFSKLSDLQTKKEKTSSHREATEIQSTQARNEYIMSLTAANAHLHHFYVMDLPDLVKNLDDDVLDKSRNFMLALIEKEIGSLSCATDGMSKANQLVQDTSSQFTTNAFLSDPPSMCISEELVIDFEPCDGDAVTTVSTEHNADLALQHDVTKWMSCFQKECRNLCRLTTQLVKCQGLQASGHKSVEVRGVGQVNLDTQIEEVKQQIRKCDISKCKARARLTALKEGGMPVEDLSAIEARIKMEMKQVSLDVDTSTQALSRTSSMKSTNVSENHDGRGSAMESKSFSEDDNHTPEPEQYVKDYDQEDSEERTTPAPSYNAYESSGWSDSGAGWADEPAAWAPPNPSPPAANTSSIQVASEQLPKVSPTHSSSDFEDKNQEPASTDQQEWSQAAEESAEAPDAGVPVDGIQMVGKVCRAVYAYQAQNTDELEVAEEEQLTIVSASDKDWVTAQNVQGHTGFVPAAYLEVIGDAPELPAEYEEIATAETDYYDPEPVPEPGTTGNGAASDFPGADGPEGEFVRALYDYEATSGEEISFSEGDMIRILDRSEDGWWTGEKDGVRGHFPSMLVAELGEDEEEEDEDEEEEVEEGGAFGDESEDGESGGGSAGSPAATTPTSAPPPTFAPPKPIHLVPQQIVIMQPTPEIESKGTFGEGLELTTDDVVSTDDGIGEENSENEVADSVTPEKKSQPTLADANSQGNTVAEQEPDQPEELPLPPPPLTAEESDQAESESVADDLPPPAPEVEPDSGEEGRVAPRTMPVIPTVQIHESPAQLRSPEEEQANETHASANMKEEPEEEEAKNKSSSTDSDVGAQASPDSDDDVEMEDVEFLERDGKKPNSAEHKDDDDDEVDLK